MPTLDDMPHQGSTLPPTARDGIARQEAAYREAVLAHLEPGQPYCIVGFPDHDNSGDSAIYLGELKLFDEIGAPLRYVCSQRSFSNDIATHYPEGPIFLHGGGNFGDLYKEHGLRLSVLKKYRERKVVQLPQTIHFQNPDNIERTARVIEEHGDFHLMVRDECSLDFARRHFACHVSLVPDAAYCIAQLAPSRRVSTQVLSIKRLDEEQGTGSSLTDLDALGPVYDWQFGRISWRFRTMRAERGLRFRLTAQSRREAEDIVFRAAAYRRRAEDRLAVAVDLLSRARVIVSDRLHAHIISSLLGKPHVALDNSYGKISGYIGTWGNDGLALLASTPDEIRAAVAHHLSGAAVPVQLGTGWSRLDGES